MRKLPLDNIFVPDVLPAVESVGLRANRNSLSLSFINAESVVVAELVLTPEDGWELARDIVTIADKAAGL